MPREIQNHYFFILQCNANKADITGKEAKLIGKPSSIFFKSGLKILGFPENSEFYMLGDDLETDIEGAQKLGGKGILIYTGKTNYPLPENSDIKPDFEVMNLSEMINLY